MGCFSERAFQVADFSSDCVGSDPKVGLLAPVTAALAPAGGGAGRLTAGVLPGSRQAQARYPQQILGSHNPATAG